MLKSLWQFGTDLQFELKNRHKYKKPTVKSRLKNVRKINPKKSNKMKICLGVGYVVCVCRKANLSFLRPRDVCVCVCVEKLKSDIS